MNGPSVRFAVVLPVGPDPAEAERAAWLLHSLERFEPGAETIALVDDHFPPRDWSHLPQVTWVGNPRRGQGSGTLGGLCCGVLAALGKLPHELDFVLRIDTDALIVAPFAERVKAALAAAPGTGVAGSYDDAGPDGRRDWSAWTPFVERLAGWRGRLRTPRASSVVRDALQQGWQPGESCLGGACVLSGAFAEVIRGEEPVDWLHTGLGDDVMLGAMARSAGFGFLSLTGPGGVMAVSHVGLNDTPENIRAAGRAIVHSVRNDARWSEAELRERLLA